jgi:hypothetical protein
MSLHRQERHIDEFDRQAEREGQYVKSRTDRRLMVAKGLGISEGQEKFDALFKSFRSERP